MALTGLKIACSCLFVYLCIALLASAKEFSPLTGEDFGQKYDPEPWGQGIEKPAAQTLAESTNAFYKEAEIANESQEKRGTKNDRLRGLRRLSRLYGELGLDNLRPVKKTPETADDMYSLDDKRAILHDDLEQNQAAMPKRDAGPHAWYGTGMFGKRTDENRGRWRIRSPRPGPFRIGLFGKREYDSLDMKDIASLLESMKDQEARR